MSIFSNMSDSDISMLVWLVLIFVFLIVEACTVGLMSVWFALGSFCAFVVSVFCEELWVQITVFLLVSIITLIGYIIWMKKFKKEVESTGARTQVGDLIGRECLVIEALDKLHGKGRIKIDGVDWKAEYTDDTVIPVGITVRIVSSKGVTLYVERKE
mgnify:CR=1 FL=1